MIGEDGGGSSGGGKHSSDIRKQSRANFFKEAMFMPILLL